MNNLPCPCWLDLGHIQRQEGSVVFPQTPSALFPAPWCINLHWLRQLSMPPDILLRSRRTTLHMAPAFYSPPCSWFEGISVRWNVAAFKMVRVKDQSLWVMSKSLSPATGKEKKNKKKQEQKRNKRCFPSRAGTSKVCVLQRVAKWLVCGICHMPRCSVTQVMIQGRRKGEKPGAAEQISGGDGTEPGLQRKESPSHRVTEWFQRKGLSLWANWKQTGRQEGPIVWLLLRGRREPETKSEWRTWPWMLRWIISILPNMISDPILCCPKSLCPIWDCLFSGFRRYFSKLQLLFPQDWVLCICTHSPPHPTQWSQDVSILTYLKWTPVASKGQIFSLTT